jgi:hypothetical protein
LRSQYQSLEMLVKLRGESREKFQKCLDGKLFKKIDNIARLCPC